MEDTMCQSCHRMTYEIEYGICAKCLLPIVKKNIIVCQNCKCVCDMIEYGKCVKCMNAFNTKMPMCVGIMYKGKIMETCILKTSSDRYISPCYYPEKTFKKMMIYIVTKHNNKKLFIVPNKVYNVFNRYITWKDGSIRFGSI